MTGESDNRDHPVTIAVDSSSSSSSSTTSTTHNHTHTHHTPFHTSVFSESSEALVSQPHIYTAEDRTADESDEDLEWEEWRPDQISFLSHMVAGSFAGLAEHVSLYPVDTIKTHLQCQRCGNSSSSSWTSTMKMIQREGVMRLWRGVGAMFTGCVPAHAAYFSIFESTKRLVGADAEGHHPLGAALTGATAALSHDMLITPFDVMKQRMQLGYYRSVSHCLREILRSEGVGAFYVALPTTLLMNLPHGSIVVAVNESMRKLLNPSGKYDIKSSLTAGCVAGAVAAAITTPVDVIKTRLQTQNMLPCGETSPEMCIKTIKQRYVQGRAAGEEVVIVPKMPRNNGVGLKMGSTVGSVFVDTRSSLHTHAAATGPHETSTRGNIVAESAHWLRNNLRTVWSVARSVARDEGVRGFYRGTIPRVMTQAPAVAISWTAYESFKSALGFVQSRVSTD